jgi:hypothetical protein
VRASVTKWAGLRRRTGLRDERRAGAEHPYPWRSREDQSADMVGVSTAALEGRAHIAGSVLVRLPADASFCAALGRARHAQSGQSVRVGRVGETVCNGVRLSWESFGEGAPVLLIAGTGAPPITWQVGGFVPALVESGYRVATFANRGIEPSQSPPGPYSVAEMAVDTAQLIEALALSPCRVVGYSLGGQIAEELCYRHSEQVDEVVLLASAGRSTASCGFTCAPRSTSQPQWIRPY